MAKYPKGDSKNMEIGGKLKPVALHVKEKEVDHSKGWKADRGTSDGHMVRRDVGKEWKGKKKEWKDIKK